MNRADAIGRLLAGKERLEKLGVRRAYLFGSVARDGADEHSDVDVMVDLDEGVGGRKALFTAFEVGEVQYALTEVLGERVDLVVRDDALKSNRLRRTAETELVRVF